MSFLHFIKRPPSKRVVRKQKTLCYVMTKKAGVMTITASLPKVPTKGGC